jgi:DNA-binding GntR family transcriptional regulator
MEAKYHELALALESTIEALGFNAPIPSERVLADQYNVSRMTIRKAIDQLVKDNKLYRVPYVGTFTTDKKLYKKMDAFTGFTNEVIDAGGVPTTILLEYSLLSADASVASALGLDVGQHVYKVIRLRKKNNVPLIIDESYFPKAIVPLNETIVESSIYSYIQDDLKLKIVSADQKLKATFCEPKYLKHLDIDAQTPIMYVELTGYLEDGRVFEFSKSYKRSDRYELVLRSYK